MRSPKDMQIIQIDITNACPHLCSNCTRFCGHHKKPFFMDFETFKRAVDSLKDFPRLVGMMGGEPTVHPQFEKFANYLRESRVGNVRFLMMREPIPDMLTYIRRNLLGTNSKLGLWSSLNESYYKHFETINDTFPTQILNDHDNACKHQALLMSRRELGIPDDEWIKKRDEKNMLYIHFKMEDNPSLSKSVIKRYKSLYSGAFYERFIEGKWVTADGLVYPMFSHEKNVKNCDSKITEYYLSCDYGTVNPFSLGLWGRGDDGWYRIDEYYHSSRDEGVQLTDEEYYERLEELASGKSITAVVIDPSAASFIQTVKRHCKYRVIRANNDVLSGINLVCQALKNQELYICPCCQDAIREFSVYRWDNSVKRDSVRKENDHAMDDIRYFVSTVMYKQKSDGFASFAIERR